MRLPRNREAVLETIGFERGRVSQASPRAVAHLCRYFALLSTRHWSATFARIPADLHRPVRVGIRIGDDLRCAAVPDVCADPVYGCGRTDWRGRVRTYVGNGPDRRST